MKQIFIPIFVLISGFAGAADEERDIYTDPAKAGPDYAVQGEYLGTLKVGDESAEFGLQVIALGMLLVPQAMLTVPWVMAAQALSGIAKDLNKMSAKSAIKLLVPSTHRPCPW